MTRHKLRREKSGNVPEFVCFVSRMFYEQKQLSAKGITKPTTKPHTKNSSNAANEQQSTEQPPSKAKEGKEDQTKVSHYNQVLAHRTRRDDSEDDDNCAAEPQQPLLESVTETDVVEYSVTEVGTMESALMRSGRPLGVERIKGVLRFLLLAGLK